VVRSSLQGQALPEILKDKINFEVMGANIWRHVRSLDAMSDLPTRVYLTAQKRGDFYLLSNAEPAGGGAVMQTFDLADRSDVDRTPPTTGDIIDKAIDPLGSVVFESAAFDRPVELSGLFSGRLAFMTNKKDFDVQVSL
jgi:uncharacterized protein